MDAEELYNLKEDVAALVSWRQNAEQRLHFIEEHVTDPKALAELRRLKSMQQIEDFRHGR